MSIATISNEYFTWNSTPSVWLYNHLLFICGDITTKKTTEAFECIPVLRIYDLPEGYNTKPIVPQWITLPGEGGAYLRVYAPYNNNTIGFSSYKESGRCYIGIIFLIQY